MITFIVDEVTPCLVDTLTGDKIETEVVRIKRKSFLSKFNTKTGWYVNWGSFDSNVQIYALVLKGTVDIQGLIALEPADDAKAVYMRWACTAPQNNIYKNQQQKYSGVGGHLIALASDISLKYGYEGFVYGEAADRALFEYYIEAFGATPLPALNNPYRIMLSGKATERLREVYDYEWTDEII